MEKTEFEFFSKDLTESFVVTLPCDARAIENFKEGLRQDGVSPERMISRPKF